MAKGMGSLIASKVPPPDKLGKPMPAGGDDEMAEGEDMAAADGAFEEYLSALGVDAKGVDIPAATAALRDYLDAAGYVRK
jgi:hypothetical protein